MASGYPVGPGRPPGARRATGAAAGSLGPCRSSASCLASPRGFCAGVEKAIKALAWMVRVFEPPVYCYHEIVHNRHVVEQFRRRRAWCSWTTSPRCPPGPPSCCRPTGLLPRWWTAARQRGRVVVDAVCPLVTKVHHELKVRAGKGYTVLYVGHEGHEEAVGTMAVAPRSVRLVRSEADVDAAAAEMEPATPVALLAQTTLSHDEWSDIMARARERFPELWMPNRSDLCFATTNRQAALKAIAGRSDAVVVIGSVNSSNTRALEKVARASGCARVLRVNEAAELPGDLSGTVAVTAGASAPDELVAAVVGPARPRARRGRGARHRRGRVLPAAPRAARPARGPGRGHWPSAWPPPAAPPTGPGGPLGGRRRLGAGTCRRPDPARLAG